MLIGFLDDIGWELEEDLEEGGGGVLRSHNFIREFGGRLTKFREQLSALIHMGIPFQSIHLYNFDLILLFHLTVLRNRSATRFHWCSDIYPRLGVRVNYSAFFLSIPLWNPYHSPFPTFHISCLDFLNGEQCPMLDIIIICNSNQEVPQRSLLFYKYNHWVSHPDGINFSRCHRGPRNIIDFFYFRPIWCLGCC